MSRSSKKHAITGITTASTEKWSKRQEKGRLRMELRGALAAGDHDRASYDARDDVWSWPKDGRRDWTGTDYEAEARRK